MITIVCTHARLYCLSSRCRDPDVPLHSTRSLRQDTNVSSRRSKQAKHRAQKMRKMYMSEREVRLKTIFQLETTVLQCHTTSARNFLIFCARCFACFDRLLETFVSCRKLRVECSGTSGSLQPDDKYKRACVQTIVIIPLEALPCLRDDF